MITKLSKNFSLEEFLVSQTAERNGIDMTPPDKVVDNLQKLVTTCMQPLRDRVRQAIFISSGYRPYKLNRLIGGSSNSAHMDGRACDFKIVRRSPYSTVQLVHEMELPFDQCIHEFGRWVHLGISDNPRNQILTAGYMDNKTVYLPGLQTMDVFA